MHFEHGLSKKIHGSLASALLEKVLGLHEKMGDRPPHRPHEARIYTWTWSNAWQSRSSSGGIYGKKSPWVRLYFQKNNNAESDQW